MSIDPKFVELTAGVLEIVVKNILWIIDYFYASKYIIYYCIIDCWRPQHVLPRSLL